MQFNSAIALAVITFTTSVAAQGYYEDEYSLYAREADEYDQVLAIREEAYLEGYYHGLVARANGKPAAKPVSKQQQANNRLSKDAGALGQQQNKLNTDRAAFRTANRKEQSDVTAATKDGKITSAEEKTLAADSKALAADRKSIGGDKAAIAADKARLTKDASSFGRRSYDFYDEFDFDF